MQHRTEEAAFDCNHVKRENDDLLINRGNPQNLMRRVIKIYNSPKEFNIFYVVTVKEACVIKHTHRTISQPEDSGWKGLRDDKMATTQTRDAGMTLEVSNSQH